MARGLFGVVWFGSVLASCAGMLIACNTGTAGNQSDGGESTANETGDSSGGTEEEDDGAADLTGLLCDTDGVAGGDWETGEVEDWSNPGTTGLEVADFNGQVDDPIDDADPAISRIFASKPGVECDIAGSAGNLYGSVDSSIAAHHCYTTAVHAVHVQTEDARDGALLVMHGENDQRLWDIAAAGDHVASDRGAHELGGTRRRDVGRAVQPARSLLQRSRAAGQRPRFRGRGERDGQSVGRRDQRHVPLRSGRRAGTRGTRRRGFRREQRLRLDLRVGRRERVLAERESRRRLRSVVPDAHGAAGWSRADRRG
jgi:hypothetical protein